MMDLSTNGSANSMPKIKCVAIAGTVEITGMIDPMAALNRILKLDITDDIEG